MFGFNSFYFHFLLIYVCYAIFVSLVFIKHRHTFIYLFCLFLPLIVLSVLRGNTVGGDLVYHYLPNYHAACKARSFEALMATSTHEPGYVVFTKMIGFISDDDRAFLAITGGVSLIGPFFLIYKYSPNYISSVLIYYTAGYYTNTFNNVRQSLALSLFFLSIPFLINKKPLYYYLLVLLACTFHYSALPLLFVYPLVKYNITIKKAISILLFGGLSYLIAGSSIIYSLVALIFVKYSPESMLEKAGAGWNLLLLRGFMLCVFMYMYYKYKKGMNTIEERFYSILMTFLLLALVFQLYATLYSSATRMEQYFYIPTIILIPYYGSRIRSKFMRICYFHIIIIYCLVFFNQTYSQKEGTNTSPQGVIPYVFVDKTFSLW